MSAELVDMDDAGRVGFLRASDSIVVLSVAMGRNLFPWFQSLGITVDSRESQLAKERAFQILAD